MHSRSREGKIHTSRWGLTAVTLATMAIIACGDGASPMPIARNNATLQAAATTDGIPPIDPQENPRGHFFLVSHNGIACVTTPCFSMEAQRLNSHRPPKSISGLAGDGTLLQKAHGALASGPIIVMGHIARADADQNEGDPDAPPPTNCDIQNGEQPDSDTNCPLSRPQMRGRILQIFQLFTQVASSDDGDQDGDPLHCEADTDCVFSPFSKNISNQDECYWPCCSVSTIENRTTADAYQSAWGQYCPDFFYVCPEVCPEPPTIACVDHQCVEAPHGGGSGDDGNPPSDPDDGTNSGDETQPDPDGEQPPIDGNSPEL